ncbi:hypothetical protein PALA111701_16940 [Paenibacillus lactis]
MLDVTALSTLSTKPRIDQISLELLRQYYERNLEPNIFIFELDNGIMTPPKYYWISLRAMTIH